MEAIGTHKVVTLESGKLPKGTVIELGVHGLIRDQKVTMGFGKGDELIYGDGGVHLP